MVWLLLGAVPGALLSFSGALLLGVIQERRPELYFVVQAPVAAPFEGGSRYVLGCVELGNDGTAPIKDWTARISFPPNAQLLDYAATEGYVPRPLPQTSEGPVIPVSYGSIEHVLNPGDRVLVRYLLATDSKPTVIFKGFGSTGAERQPQRPKATASELALALVAVLVSVVSCVAVAWGVLRDRKADLKFRKLLSE
ncbi:MAG TPA: hypothetical protein VM031_05035 [Phycisphaerae bacterium]|nr:hypothetical protein [Phycisphaerae bacterium]